MADDLSLTREGDTLVIRVLVCANHFPSPSYGCIVRNGAGFDFVADTDEGR